MSDAADVTPVYQRVRALLVDFLFDLNQQVLQDTAIILSDGGLTVADMSFAESMQLARRDAIADLCVYLSAGAFPAMALPSVAARHWLLGCLLTFEGDDAQIMAWHGYKYVERAILTFEEQFEQRVFNA